MTFKRIVRKVYDNNLPIYLIHFAMIFRDVKENTYLDNGWGDSCYAVSKVGVSALTVVQQRNFDDEIPYRNVSVNSVHPGYVITDLTGNTGNLTVDEGAKAPLYLALDDHNLKGKYVWYNSTLIEWTAPSTPTRY